MRLRKASVGLVVAAPGRRVLGKALPWVALPAALLCGWRLTLHRNSEHPAIPHFVEPSGRLIPAASAGRPGDAGARGLSEASVEPTPGAWASGVKIAEIAAMLGQIDALWAEDRRAAAREALLKEWAAKDLIAALTWFGSRNVSDPLQQAARDILARAMAARKPEDMLLWAERHLPENSRKEIYGPFFRAWADRDPATAAGLLVLLVQTSPGGSQADADMVDLLGQVSSVWSGREVKQAVGWMKALPEGPAKERALEQMAYRWTEAEPALAAAFVARHHDPELVATVAGKWAETDPSGAAAWVMALPSGEQMSRALDTLVGTWSRRNSAAASAFLASLPETPARERAALALASALEEMR